MPRHKLSLAIILYENTPGFAHALGFKCVRTGQSTPRRLLQKEPQGSTHPMYPTFGSVSVREDGRDVDML